MLWKWNLSLLLGIPKPWLLSKHTSFGQLVLATYFPFAKSTQPNLRTLTAPSLSPTKRTPTFTLPPSGQFWGLSVSGESWDRYDHVTDSGILEDICADNGLVLARDDLEQIKNRFVGSLARHIDTAGSFPEIPGARDFVSAKRVRSLG